jgi:hypothetical protein
MQDLLSIIGSDEGQDREQIRAYQLYLTQALYGIADEARLSGDTVGLRAL